MYLVNINLLLKLITGSSSHILYNNYYHRDSDESKFQSIDTIKSLLFSIIIKFLIPKNTTQKHEIVLNNDYKINDHHDTKDSDSLYLVNIQSSNDFIFYNNCQVNKGEFWLSKNEIIYLISRNTFVFLLKKQAFYQIIAKEKEYIEIVDDIFEFIHEKFCNETLQNMILKFKENTSIEYRNFVADCIIRDYCNLLKQEVDNLSCKGYRLCKIENTKIFFI